MSSLKESRAMVESGHLEHWGRVFEVLIKKYKFGVCFLPFMGEISPRGRGQAGAGLIKFSSFSPI